jgi:hypothetical protein
VFIGNCDHVTVSSLSYGCIQHSLDQPTNLKI